jgi:hypothetical protein
MKAMWNWQRAFRALAAGDAREVFSHLDDNLKPNVFLVGIPWHDEGSVHFEPQDCGYGPSQLASVETLARSLETSAPEARRSNGQEVLHAAMNEALQSHDKEIGAVSFCSFPQPVSGYMVATVIQFDREAFSAHHALASDEAGPDRVYVSLLDAVVDEFLSECAQALAKLEPGRLGVIGREADEIIRAAGRKFMYTPGFKTQGMLDLFNACNTIASMRYEGGESIGRLLIARRDHSEVDVALALRQPIGVRDFRAVRKLLEISADGLCLLCAGAAIYGLGTYRQLEDDLFLVNFTGHHSWELVHGAQVLMEVRYGQPQLPKKRIDETRFRGEVERIFGAIKPDDLDRLWTLVLEASQQKHGTMVVVSAGAEEEASRLGTQATLVEPLVLTPELMRVVTAIDGAVLIDHRSTCYAIGVILDGRASSQGDASRGARYNSAVRYAEASPYACLAIVVSEDGAIDLISNPA